MDWRLFRKSTSDRPFPLRADERTDLDTDTYGDVRFNDTSERAFEPRESRHSSGRTIGRLLAAAGLLWAFLAPLVAICAPCPPNLPNSPNAITVQGASPDASIGYPISVVSACPLDVNITGGGGGCVTQCTSPWVVSGTVAATQSGAWTVGVNNFPATQPVSGTVTANQGTNPWIVAGTKTSNSAAPDANNVGTLGAIANAAAPALTEGDQVALSTNLTGFLRVASSSASGAMLDTAGNTVNQFVDDAGNVIQLAQRGFCLNGSTVFWERNRSINGLPDAGSGTGVQAAAQVARVSGSTVSPLRTPAIFKTATATANGNTVVWTPAAGKKFRLQRYFVQVTEDAAQAVAGDLEITLNDSGAAIGLGQSCFVPAASLVASGDLMTGPWVDLGNGKLSAAANNVLNVNLSAALTAGEVRVTVCGTEE